jgi:hypothetical protein
LNVYGERDLDYTVLSYCADPAILLRQKTTHPMSRLAFLSD